MSEPKVARCVILRGGALGDFVLTLPAIAAARRALAGAVLEVAGRPGAVELAVELGVADRIWSLESAESSALFAPGCDVPESLARRFGTCDLVVSFLSDSDGVVEANLRRLTPGRVVCAAPIVNGCHAAEHFLRCIARAGLATQCPDSFSVSAKRAARGRALLERSGASSGSILIVHPGSGSPAKNWPVARFAALILELGRLPGMTFAIVAGEADAAAVAALRTECPTVPVLDGMGVLDLAGVLSCARAFVGNDSGVTHLAAGLGIPTVAVFGPTDPALWAPRGPRVRVLRAADGRLDRVSVGDVLRSLEEVGALR